MLLIHLGHMLHGFWILHAFFYFSSNRPFVPHSIVSNFLRLHFMKPPGKNCVLIYTSKFTKKHHQPNHNCFLFDCFRYVSTNMQHVTKLDYFFDGALCDSRTVFGHAFDPNLRTIDSFCELFFNALLVVTVRSKNNRPMHKKPSKAHSQTLTQQFQEELGGLGVRKSMIPEYEWQWVTKWWQNSESLLPQPGKNVLLLRGPERPRR